MDEPHREQPDDASRRADRSRHAGDPPHSAERLGAHRPAPGRSPFHDDPPTDEDIPAAITVERPRVANLRHAALWVTQVLDAVLEVTYAEGPLTIRYAEGPSAAEGPAGRFRSRVTAGLDDPTTTPTIGALRYLSASDDLVRAAGGRWRRLRTVRGRRRVCDYMIANAVPGAVLSEAIDTLDLAVADPARFLWCNEDPRLELTICAFRWPVDIDAATARLVDVALRGLSTEFQLGLVAADPAVHRTV